MSVKSNKTIRVAAAQINAFDINANLQKHLDYIKHAQKEKADIVVFPELSLCGYNTGNDTLKVAMTAKDDRLKELANAAGDMPVIVGFVEEGPAAQIYNSSIVLQKDREFFVHRKLNLCTYGRLEEGKFFAGGKHVEAFHLPHGFVASVMICADMWNPALVHLSMLRGATILFSPAASARDVVSPEFSNPTGWDTLLRFYGMIYGMPVVMSNHVGTSGKLSFWGGSCIVDASGTVLDRLGDEEGLVVGDVDYNDMRHARFMLPTVRDSNFSLIQREMERIGVDFGVPAGLMENLTFGRKAG